MGILTGNPKDEPLHYGEVYCLWMHLAMNKSMVAGYQTLYNHTGDDDLRKLIHDKISYCVKEEMPELEDMLKKHGVVLPPTPPARAEADLELIPPGARFNDAEIGQKVMVDTAAALMACSKAMGESMREDIAAMFGKFHVNAARFGLHALRLNKQKGWLVVPPLHVAPTEAHE